MAPARKGLARICMGIGGALLAVWFATLPALGAEGVTVRAWPHEGFGRIVFEWPSPVGFEAGIDEGSVTVRFDHEFEADYARVRQHLSTSVSTSVRSAGVPTGDRSRSPLLDPIA